MSKKHPVVAVTGSSGAGTTTVKRAFEHIFYRDGINAAIVEGDSFHRYDRAEMKVEMAKAAEAHRNLSHFGADANRFDLLEELFRSYGETGTGKKRYYIHSEEEAAEHNARLGTDHGEALIRIIDFHQHGVRAELGTLMELIRNHHDAAGNLRNQVDFHLGPDFALGFHGHQDRFGLDRINVQGELANLFLVFLWFGFRSHQSLDDQDTGDQHHHGSKKSE